MTQTSDEKNRETGIKDLLHAAYGTIELYQCKGGEPRIPELEKPLEYLKKAIEMVERGEL